MILRCSRLFCASFLLFSSYALAQDPCVVNVDGHKFDWESIKDEHIVSRTRESPPTTMLDSVRFNLCGELQPLGDVSEKDQCPPGTRACLTTINQKDGESDRIVSVIPIVQTDTMKPSYSILSSPNGISATLHGPDHPDPLTSTPTPQSLNITLLCNKAQDVAEPKFTSYENGELRIEWATPAGCADQEGSGGSDEGPDGGSGNDQPEPGQSPVESVGSGIGWFFLVLLLGVIAYLVLGAYYNYSTYGATGLDLIPHRDFWQEVPFMFRDVVSHLCSSGRARHTSNRGGYISV